MEAQLKPAHFVRVSQYQPFQNCSNLEPTLPRGIFLKKMTPLTAAKGAHKFWNGL
jgi:hypothetical protein